MCEFCAPLVVESIKTSWQKQCRVLNENSEILSVLKHNFTDLFFTFN